VIYPRIAARSLTADMLRSFSDAQMTAFAAAVGGFMSFLHGASIPKDIAVPRGEKDLESMLAQTEARIDFIEEHKQIASGHGISGHDIDSLRQKLVPFRGTMKQQWTLNHADLGFGNIMLHDDAPHGFSIIDFNDAEVCDPSLDFNTMAGDLEDEGLNANEIMEAVLAHYDLDDGTMREKMAFRVVLREIAELFRRVRRDVRRAA